MLLDAGGPMLYVFFGGVIVAAVLGAVALVFLGFWVSRRMKRKAQSQQDPEVHS